MARGKGSVNKVILVGRCGADPELRTLPSGSQVVNLSVATTETWRDRDNNPQERTEWHRVSMFGNLAEIAGNWLRKGSLVYLEGSLRTRKWVGQDGADRYSTEVMVDQMTMLGGRGDSGGVPASPPEPAAEQSFSAPAAGAGKTASATAPGAAAAEEFVEDDIPF